MDPRGGCNTQQILYRSKGQDKNAELAKVVIGYTRGGDVISEISNYFLYPLNEKIISLGEFRQGNSFWVNAKLFELLQLKGTNAGVAGVNPSILYDRIVDSDSYCVFYRLKPPFTGELRDCRGNHDSVEGKADYAPNVMSLPTAASQACKRVEADTSRKCRNNDVEQIGASLHRDSDESLYYYIVLRRRLGENPVEFDYLIYRVDALGGLVTLIDHTRQDPTRRRSQ
jgi:hypothetical protein